MSNGGSMKDLAGAAYCIAALLVVLPVLDFVTNVWPLHLGLAVWRYGSVGLFSGYMLTPLLGALLACAVALDSGHWRTLRVLAWSSMLIAVAFVILTGLFALDAFEVRANVPPSGKSRFDVGIWRGVLKYLVVAVALAWLGMAARRAGRHAHHRRQGAKRDAPPAVLS